MRLPKKESDSSTNPRSGTMQKNWLIPFAVSAIIRKSIREKSIRRTSTSPTTGSTSNSKEG